MFRNYIKSTLRFLGKNKLFTGINLLGLSLALAVSFIIILYVVNEISYNSCYSNKQNIYSIYTDWTESHDKLIGTPFVMASALKEEFPEITAATNMRNDWQIRAKIKDEYIRVRAVCTNDDFFKIFTLPFKWGNADNELLTNPDAIVLSESLAKKVYGDENPVGKEFLTTMYNTEKIFTVTGVYKDFPKNSTLQAECLVNEKWAVNEIDHSFGATDARTNWDRDFWVTWILLDKKANINTIAAQLPGFEMKHLGEYAATLKDFKFLSLKNLYLHSSGILNMHQVGKTGDLKNVRLFTFIAILIVLVAIFNYIILSTAVSSLRAKEIGIRKSSGASSQLLRNQFFGESLMIAFASLPFALLLAWLALPAASNLFDTKLQIMSSNVGIYIIVYLMIALLVGMASGLYSAGYLARVKVIDVLKKQRAVSFGKLSLRSALVVIQLVIFCSLVASAMIVRSQYLFSLHKDMGYKSQDVLLVDIPSGNQYTPLLDKLKATPNVINTGGTSDVLPTENSSFSMVPCVNDPSTKIRMEYMSVDFNFLETMGVTPVEGRLFSEAFSNDANCTILNETAVKQLGVTNPVGKKILGQQVVGVVKDFNLHSLHSTIPPLSIQITKRYLHQIAIAYQPGTRDVVVSQLKTYWQELVPDKTLNYYDVEDIYTHIYSSEKNLSKIISLAALFTAIISALGLLGLTLFEARSKTKEIGIKKTLGSSSNEIIYAFGRKNIILVLTANIFSIPITFIIINKWLASYAYKTPIHSWIFILAGIITLLITLITISWQSWRAATQNPVEALRYE